MGRVKTIIIVLILIAILAWSVSREAQSASPYSWEVPSIKIANQTVEYVWLYRWSPPEPWESVEELEAFLEQDDTNKHIYLRANSEGVVSFVGQCEEFALQLIDRAFAIGKTLHFVPLHRSEYIKWWIKWESPSKRTPRYNEYHAVAGAIIGNDFWYIEPDTDVHFKALELD